jgi:hypothetical protein
MVAQEQSMVGGAQSNIRERGSGLYLFYIACNLWFAELVYCV